MTEDASERGGGTERIVCQRSVFSEKMTKSPCSVPCYVGVAISFIAPAWGSEPEIHDSLSPLN